MTLIETAIKAPDFVLKDQNGKPQRLYGFRGSYVLLYFYPKDETPGCTKEACAIRDEFANFKRNKIKIFGISADSIESHRNFAKNHNLPFTLLSDTGRKVIKSYGAQDIEGNTLRVSILIGKNGDIIKTYPKVDPASHAKQILDDFREIENSPDKGENNFGR